MSAAAAAAGGAETTQFFDARTRWVRAAPGVRYCIAWVATLVVTLLSQWPELRSPLGRDDASSALAVQICAARNFEARGALESGLLAVADPLPVSVAEGLVSTRPPLFAWVTLAIRGATHASFAVSARAALILFLCVGAAAVFSLAARRAGAVGAFVAAAYFALAPVASQHGADSVAGCACTILFAASLEGFIRRGEAWRLGWMIAAALLGALADWRCALDGAVLAIVGAAALRRRAFSPAVAVALTAPLWCGALVLAAMERLCGSAKLLAQNGLWRTAGFDAPPLDGVGWDLWIDQIAAHLWNGLLPAPLVLGAIALAWFLLRRTRASAVVLALLIGALLSTVVGARAAYVDRGWQVRFAAPIGIGMAIAVGSVVLRWRVGAVLMACAFVVAVLGQVSPDGARDADWLTSFARSVQRRVAFGDAFATTEPRALCAAATQRRVYGDLRTTAAIESFVLNAPTAAWPVRWFVTYNEEAATEPARAWLKERFAFEVEGGIVAFDLTAPRNGDAAIAAGALQATFVPPRTFELQCSSAPAASALRVRIGTESAKPDFEVEASGSPPRAVLPEGRALAEKYYLSCVGFDAAGKQTAAWRETCVRALGVKKLRSKVLLLVPLATAFVALLAMLMQAANAGRVAPRA